ncbi:ferredoxin--NADP reductase [Bowmanella dokdonensis]|uniref:ferredoxin--NADP(+) reductase n=1 Tax=Bowmanella dokdonensis TaxID=751969 RepID=A0A939DTS2_9ALTE|nr:ferredoxin--NADP reductase [Bowmanella dokdonensis]MBN7827741.1 ferredoxin--NADP reductase [Bowmanella dokdonensis]
MWVEGRVVDRIDWNDKLFSLFIEADIGNFIPGQFIKVGLDIGDKRIGRAYSLVNAPDSPALEVLLVSVEDGLLSPALARLNPGDAIQVSSKASGYMTLDEISQGKHLWMLATGTAVGPFIAMLRTPQPWQRFERLVLCYGVRLARDLAYLEELQALQSANPQQFSLIPCVTREKIPDMMQIRLPEALRTGQLEQAAGLKISPEQSQFMLCGNPGMVSDAQQILLDRGLQKNLKRKPGHITMERYW